MRARSSAAAVSFCALAVPAPPAGAVAPQAVVAYSGGYVPSEAAIVQGGSLTLVNSDPALSHDLVSLDRFPSGGYKFRSDVIGPASAAPVTGVESLPPSVYPFYCSVHEYMTGNLTVLAVPS